MLNVNSKSKGTTTDKEIKNQKKIAPVFLSNGLSSTLIIPIELARKYSLDKPSHVTIEDTQNGILIKKLVVE